jgi:hypothetical protein
MATTYPTPGEVVQQEDVVPVRSRVSWGAIFAGAVVALAAYFLLSVLGTAIGLSVGNRVSGETIGTGAAIWAIAAVLLSLFLGGWVTSQCAVGENKMEAAIYGLILWGVLLGMLLWLAASGIQIGFNALVGVASTPVVRDVVGRLSEEDMRAAGLNQEQIQSLQAKAQNLPAELQAAAQDPGVRRAAWWTFGGFILSLLAAIGGAVAGAGPYLALRGFAVRTTAVRTIQPAR